MLHEFIQENRQELIERTRAKVATRTAPRVTTHEVANGVPLFLTQLGAILEQEAARAAPDSSEMGVSAAQHGSDLLKYGFSIAQVVHGYGDVCQSITELAMDLRTPITTDDFRILNRCLDDAIANAVTEYTRQHDAEVYETAVKRQGFLVHELRNHLNSAVLAFQVVKSGKVGVTGSTMGVLERGLGGLRELIDRSVSEVRSVADTHEKERLRVAEFIEEMKIDASIDATNRGVQLKVEHVDSTLLVEVDRHRFSSALSNLVQNAVKFTRPAGQVRLRTGFTDDVVWIEVEDECGGFRPGAVEAASGTFGKNGTDGAGLGLGLAISRHAVESDGGVISHRDVPGKGCIFTIEMPRAFGEPGPVATPRDVCKPPHRR